ncbi:MAG: hypothetical protein ACOCRX_11760 [Candidatus Woesearchaeota archaeon]
MLKEFKRSIKEINEIAKDTNKNKPIVGEVYVDVFPDEEQYMRIEDLKTEYNFVDGNLNIINSDRYTNEDVKKYGQEKVLEWIKDDEKHYKKFINGDLWMNGLQTIAKIYLPNNMNGYTIQYIRSHSTCGIASDSIEEGIQGIKDDQLYELEKYLKMLGCVINRPITK